MKAYESIAEIEAFAETPANRVVGRYSCLLTQSAHSYGCYWPDRVTWVYSGGPGEAPRAEKRMYPEDFRRAA